MANITPTKNIDIDKELGELQLYKYHPNAIVQVSLNRLQDMLGGKVKLLEPSTPFTYLLETTCLNTAFAVQEFAMLTRKLYPRLANSDDDLYLHMSDYDFLGRFSEPSYAKVVFNIMFSDFESKASFDPVLREYVFKLPRHLKVLVGKYVYLLTSAIVMRLNANGVVDVRFENQDFNNIFPVQTNHINFSIKNVNNNEQYINFELDLPEVDVEVSDIPVDRTAVFSGTLGFTEGRQFYFLRAFYNRNGEWKEMLVTHTNEVYDILTPTCIIKVKPTTNEITYTIPSVYLNTDMVTGNIRILVYTTTGYSLVNFSDYRISDFSVEYGDVFPEIEMDRYTAPLQTITKVVYIQDNVSGGKDGLTFDQLKAAVIDNSIGDRKLPITNKQLEFSAGRNTFRIIKDVDVVTNRIYKLETQTPPPSTRYPLTKYNLDILEHNTTISALRGGNNISVFGENITVLPEGTIFRLDEGVLQHVGVAEAEQLRTLGGPSLAATVNSITYLSLYYHYVLDTSANTAVLRAYDLTTPKVKKSSFKSFNASARVGINTITNNLYKGQQGYTLDIISNLKKFTETINQTNVKPYLVFTDVAGSRYFLEGALVTVVNEQPVYRFSIESDYFIDASDSIRVLNFLDAGGRQTPILMNLHPQLQIVYVSNAIPPGFSSSEMDEIIQTSFLSGGVCAVTLEDLSIEFGSHLEHLYSAVHSSTGTYDYEIYADDVMLRHTKTVYSPDNSVLYHVGELFLDDLGNPVIEHPKGSVILNHQGVPSPIPTLEMQRFLNLLFIDYRVTVCNGKLEKTYASEIKNHITSACLNSAETVHKELLDNSQAFVVVPKTVGHVRVKTVNAVQTIPSAQKFSVSVYVQYDVFNNAEVRDSISYSVIKTIDTYLHENGTLKKTELLNLLFTDLREFVVSIGFDHFTQIEAEYLQVVDANSRLSVDKTLVVTPTGYELKENVSVSFKLVE